ncbi:DUF7736 domain-containing protein [Acinetobacter cumulans]|uniref:DUF7736 domain-containing protein n=1 Tax=Acinetobacter cumulans TaxID=2136182 RepID=UPI002090DFFF|nr:DUF551 domain-containing protein [Acinetobacter cumulans]
MDIQKLTKEQAVIISGFTGILCGEFSDFHADVEKRLGRGVQTFEFGFKEFSAEVKRLYEADFIEMGTVSKEEAKAQAVPRWISTSDRMPKEGEEVLVHSLGRVRQVTRDSKWAGGFKERNCYGWQAAYGQSHWMPKNIELPEEYHFYYKNDAKQKAMIEAQEQD